MNILDFYLQDLQDLQEKEPIDEIAPVMIGLSAASMGLAAFNVYKQHLTKAARVCKDLPPREKGICMWNWKLKGKQKEYMTLKGSVGKCNKSVKPEGCRLKITKKVEKVGQQIQFIIGRLKELRGQKYE